MMAKAAGYERCTVKGCRKKSVSDGLCKDHSEVEVSPPRIPSKKEDAELAAKVKPQETLATGEDEVKGAGQEPSGEIAIDADGKSVTSGLGEIPEPSGDQENISSDDSDFGLKSLFFGIGTIAGKISRAVRKPEDV